MTSDSNPTSNPTSSEPADVITQPGLYEDRMGNVCEVTVEESQSEGKQWVVRADGSPTYYTSDGRRVSYKGPGSEHDDPCQLMRYVGAPAAAPITVKAGWWGMRDGHQIQVFEWKPDPPAPNNPFKWCGMTPAADVIFWTDGGYCNFNASPAGLYISDADLTEFLRPLDTDQIASLSDTLQQKHRVIQEMTHQITDLQSELATRRWQEMATRMERFVASHTLTIESLQSHISNLFKKQQPADHQAAIDGIAALRTENDKLSAEKESIKRLAMGKQEENDKLRQLNTELQIRLDAMTNAFESQAETSRQLQADGEQWSKTAIELQEKTVELQGKLNTQAVIIANRIADLSVLREQISQVNSYPNLSLIVTKLTKPDNQQQQQIIVSGLMILSQLVRKNMDYRGSAFTPPILMPKTSPIVAMCCRASDKIARLANLLSGTRKQVESETVLDTIGDLAGYSVLLYSYCNTIQGTAELEAIIEEFFATTTTTTDTTPDTTTIDTTEERQV